MVEVTCEKARQVGEVEEERERGEKGFLQIAALPFGISQYRTIGSVVS